MSGYDSICCFSGGNSEKKRVCWELLSRCNLECFFCHRDKELNLDFDIKDLVNVISILRNKCIKSVILSGGEPLLHPHFFYIVSELIKNGFTVDLCTNAYFQEDNFIDEIAKYFREVSVSIDWYDKSRHDKIRGVSGAFVTSVSNVKKLISKGVQIHSTTLVTDDIIDEIPNIVSYLMDLGIESMAFIGYIPFNTGVNLLLEDNNQKKLIKIFGEQREKYPLIDINTKQLLLSDESKCKAGEVVYGLDALGKDLYPCLLLRTRRKLKDNELAMGCCPGSKYYTK